jgi:hypothetical protein
MIVETIDLGKNIAQTSGKSSHRKRKDALQVLGNTWLYVITTT